MRYMHCVMHYAMHWVVRDVMPMQCTTQCTAGRPALLSAAGALGLRLAHEGGDGHRRRPAAHRERAGGRLQCGGAREECVHARARAHGVRHGVQTKAWRGHGGAGGERRVGA